MNSIIHSFYWYWFSNAYLHIYPLAVLICLIGYWVVKDSNKFKFRNWLYVFNTIVAFCTLINLALYVSELFLAWYGQNNYEWFMLTDRHNMIDPYGWSYWFLLAIQLLAPQLLWFKKLRKNLWFTLLAAFTLSAGGWFERIVIMITSTYRDFLPSSWSVQYINVSFVLNQLLNLGIFAAASSMLYWYLNKRKKLPFQPAILSYFLFFISYYLFSCTQSFN